MGMMANFFTCYKYTVTVDLMVLDIYKINPDTEEPELVFENLDQADLIWEEEQPGSTHATKLRGIVTADESSEHVQNLWRIMQSEDIRLEQEGFVVNGHKFYPKFVERLDHFNIILKFLFNCTTNNQIDTYTIIACHIFTFTLTNQIDSFPGSLGSCHDVCHENGLQ